VNVHIRHIRDGSNRAVPLRTENSEKFTAPLKSNPWPRPAKVPVVCVRGEGVVDDVAEGDTSQERAGPCSLTRQDRGIPAELDR
jgi:hypothetical protein